MKFSVKHSLVNVNKPTGGCGSAHHINQGDPTGLLLKPGPGPWTRTLKNLDPEEPGP